MQPSSNHAEREEGISGHPERAGDATPSRSSSAAAPPDSSSSPLSALATAAERSGEKDHRSPHSTSDLCAARSRGEPLSGPGRAVRAPPGTAYHVGGAVLVRRIEYDSIGNAVLRISHEPVRRAAARSQANALCPDSEAHGLPPRNASVASAAASAGGEGNRAASGEGRLAQRISPAATADTGLDAAAEVVSSSSLLADLGIWPDARVASHNDKERDDDSKAGHASNEAERVLAREQEAFYAHITDTYPLLKALPPTSTLAEQGYVAPPASTLHVAGAATQPIQVEDNAASTPSHEHEAAWSAVSGTMSLPIRPPLHPAPSPTATTQQQQQDSASSSAALAAFTVRLGSSVDEGNTLRALAWGGCRPAVLRAATWRLLSDYAPPSLARQRLELARKRRQYESYTKQYIDLAAVEEYILQNSRSHSGQRRSGAAAGTTGGEQGGRVGRLSAYSAISLGTPSLTLNGAGGPAATRDAHRRYSADSPARGTVAFAAAPSGAGLAHLAPHERAILSQLALDLPRHQAVFFHCERTVASLARCLFLWAQRHPAVGYVQGMDDLVALFFQVFLTDALRQRHRETMGASQDRREVRTAVATAASSSPPARELSAAEEKRKRDTVSHGVGVASVSSAHSSGEGAESATRGQGCGGGVSLRSGGGLHGRTSLAIPCHIHEHQLSQWTMEELDAALDDLPVAYRMQAEADTYWCAGRVLSLLQENFTPGQPGIVRAGGKLDAVVAHADPALWQYFASIGVAVRETCFPWLHCMLVRELPLPMCLLLWDTYLCLGGGDEVAAFHVYVCAALVLSMRSLATRQAPMDVVMSALKNPFAYLFPNRAASRAGGGNSAGTGVSKENRDWMAMLIADAYRLWKTCPA